MPPRSGSTRLPRPVDPIGGGTRVSRCACVAHGGIVWQREPGPLPRPTAVIPPWSPATRTRLGLALAFGAVRLLRAAPGAFSPLGRTVAVSAPRDAVAARRDSRPGRAGRLRGRLRVRSRQLPGGWLRSSARTRCPGPFGPRRAHPLWRLQETPGHAPVQRGGVNTARRTRPHQGRPSRRPSSRPQRRHKGLRPMSSRRRTCAATKHRPDRISLIASGFTDRSACRAAGSLLALPTHRSTSLISASCASKHRRACRRYGWVGGRRRLAAAATRWIDIRGSSFVVVGRRRVPHSPRYETWPGYPDPIRAVTISYILGWMLRSQSLISFVRSYVLGGVWCEPDDG